MAARTSGSIDEAEEFDEADDDEFADADADATPKKKKTAPLSVEKD